MITEIKIIFKNNNLMLGDKVMFKKQKAVPNLFRNFSGSKNKTEEKKELLITFNKLIS